MQSDKKKKDSLRFVTLRKIGEPTRLQDTSEEELRKTYEEVIGR
jgi:3-dehydroquinate synthetase